MFNIHKISASKVTDNLRAVNINDNIRKYYLNLNDANKSANLPRFPKRNIFSKISHNHSIDMNLSNDCNKVYSNKINFRQNEDNSIAMLAAQRQLYRDAKKINNVSVAVSVWIPFALAVVLLIIPGNAEWKCASYILSIVSMVLGFGIDK